MELKIAPEIATELAHLAAPLEKLPVRLVKPADIHLTLPLSLAQRIESIELFQSPPPGGTDYRILASLRLGETVGTTPTP